MPRQSSGTVISFRCGDLIRVLSVGEQRDDIDYRIEGSRLLANVDVIRLRYIYRNEDESTWDAALVDVAEMTMQSKLAYAVTGSTSLRDSGAGGLISAETGKSRRWSGRTAGRAGRLSNL